MLKAHSLLILLFIFFSSLGRANELPSYIPPVRDNFTVGEKAFNFGLMYGAQWASYLVTQRKVIKG